jgi:hypothetical protein
MIISKRNLPAILFPALLIMVIIFAAPVKVRAAGEFKCKDAGNSLYYDAANCPGTAIYEANNLIETASSSDESVFKVNIGLPYVTFTEQDRESDYCELREDGKCEIVPMGPGTATLTLTDENGKTLTETITVKEEYFSAYLKSKTAYKNKGQVGIYHSPLEDSAYTDSKISYGDSFQQVFSRYGTKVTLQLKGKTYKGTTDHSHLCTFTKVKSNYHVVNNNYWTSTGTLQPSYGTDKTSFRIYYMVLEFINVTWGTSFAGYDTPSGYYGYYIRPVLP